MCSPKPGPCHPDRTLPGWPTPDGTTSGRRFCGNLKGHLRESGILYEKELDMNVNSKSMHATESSRRAFLKTSSAMALATGLAISRSAHAAGSDVIRVALVGCGGRGAGAAYNALTAHANVKLVALADAFREPLDRSYRSPAGVRAQGPRRRAGRAQVRGAGRVPDRPLPATSTWCCCARRPAFDPLSSRRPSRPASTCSWKNRSPSTRPVCEGPGRQRSRQEERPGRLPSATTCGMKPNTPRSFSRSTTARSAT